MLCIRKTEFRQRKKRFGAGPTGKQEGCVGGEEGRSPGDKIKGHLMNLYMVQTQPFQIFNKIYILTGAF